MVEKRYEWANGAVLKEHSRRKHKILWSCPASVDGSGLGI